MTYETHHRFLYSFVEGKAEFDLADLVYVESHLHRCLFHLKNGTVWSTYRKLDDIEKMIADDRMLRIHKSYLINMDYCIRVSNYTLWIKGGQRFSVPRARYHAVKDFFVKRRVEKEGIYDGSEESDTKRK